MKKKLNVILANPRSFCAGVVRAIDIVEKALEVYGSPIYSKHEIVHNSFVVENLRKKGVIFIEDLNQVPEESVIIFSAHGVSPEVRRQAEKRKLEIIDATCPLVTKVHKEARRYALRDYVIILIGHPEHVEVIGTLGHAPRQTIVVSNLEEVEKLNITKDKKIAYVTQTTLSLDDTAEIVSTLKKKYPQLECPSKDDICYATQNRQNAVKELCKKVDLLIVIGSDISSNTLRLVEIAKKKNMQVHRIESKTEINAKWFENISSVGITAGASAPEVLVQEIIQKIDEIRNITQENLDYIAENTYFIVPPKLEKKLAEKSGFRFLKTVENLPKTL